LFRVVRPGGEVLVSVPNLAHLQSRMHFLLGGRLIHTANLAKHPGDRPVAEFIDLATRAGFRLVQRQGIFPTVPVLTRWIRRSPARLAWLHRLLSRVLPFPDCVFSISCASSARDRAKGAIAVRKSVGHLSKGVAIYGAGDAAIQVVKILLLVVYVKGGHLIQDDYGALATIGAIEMLAKLLSRWGLDGAFHAVLPRSADGRPARAADQHHRLVHARRGRDRVRRGARGRGRAGRLVVPGTPYLPAFRLMLINTFLISLTFVRFT
jgi:hypothetical protein